MERLTERNESGQAYYKKCFEEPCNGMGEGDCNTCEHSYTICERLATYEDLEITAEQVRQIDKAYTDLCAEFGEYKKLEEKGLLLKLPCALGDTVYYIDDSYVYKDKVNNIDIRKENGEYIFCIAYMDYKAGDFGKSVFLTQEAAEQALKELSKDDSK